MTFKERYLAKGPWHGLTKKIASNFSTHIMAVALCLLALAAWGNLLVYKYRHFGYHDWDLAFFSQAMWNLLHGTQYTSLVGINFFGDHSYYVMLLVLPIFSIFPHPLTLIFLKVFAFVAASFVFYRIARKALGPQAALALQGLYLLFPANVFSVLYEFNPECFAPIFIFLLYDGLVENKLRQFVIASVCLALIKENMLLITLAFGVYALFQKQKNRKLWGIILIAASTLLFYLLTCHVIPYFRESPTHAFVVRYRHLGQNMGEILTTLLLNPAKTISFLLTAENRAFIVDLFGPMLPLSLLGFPLILLASPILFQHMLSIHFPEHSIYYHYGMTIAPFIFLSVVSALRWLSQIENQKTYRIATACFLILCFFNSLTYKNEFFFRLNYHADGLTEIRKSFLAEIPKEAGVIATFDFLAELSQRKSLFSFQKIYSDLYQDPQRIKESELNVRRSFVLPPDVSYALIDFNDQWLMSDLKYNTEKAVPRIKRFFADNKWEVQKRYANIILYRKKMD